MSSNISRPDLDTLQKLYQLGREAENLLLVDILQSEPITNSPDSIPLNLIQITPTLSHENLVQRLADRIRHAYISLQDLIEELQDEGHEKLAETLRDFEFAKTPSLRSGELAEIIATDLLRNAGYIVPIERLRYKEDNDRAVPNCDTVGFYFDTADYSQDTLCISEAKSQATKGKKNKNIYEDGMKSLQTRDQMKRDKTVQFVYKKLKTIAGHEIAHYFKRFRTTFIDDKFQLKAKAVGLQDVQFWTPDLISSLKSPIDFSHTEIDAVLISDCNQLIRDAFERAIEDIRNGRANQNIT